MNFSSAGPVRCYTDGASRGNPGPSAYAFVVYSEGCLLHEEGVFIGTATNNIAEYHAVINGLRWLSGITDGQIGICSDSELVIRQITGRYSVRQPHLLTLYRDVKLLEPAFLSVSYMSVPREDPGIRKADELCNATLDTAMNRK
jgi:ribonuclease HI